MKILIDKDMLYAETLFSQLGDVHAVTGREISDKEVAQQVDSLIVRSVTLVNKDLLHGSQVKFVGTATSGIDHIDQNFLNEMGITFSSAPGCNAIAVVEYIFSVLLILAQRHNFALRDKIIGIIGVGNIGSRLHNRLEAFGVQTLLCDPPLEESGCHGDWKSLEKVVNEADILTFHIPLTYNGPYATWHQVDIELLSALPDNRILINTCRGAVVDNSALLKVLKGGKKLNVVLDVWENEPALLLSLRDRADIATAHIAGYTLEGKIRGIVQVFNAYSNFISSDKRIDITSLLPTPRIDRIRLHEDLDEDILRRLAYLVYDLQYDDMVFRRVLGSPKEFDQIRRNYSTRREWSSLCIETDDSCRADKFMQLGFNVLTM